MRRRRVLATGAFALAGCVATPSPPDTSASPPNVFVSYERLEDGTDDSTDDAYRLTFEYGTTVTELNTGRLSVVVETDAGRTETIWVSSDPESAADAETATGTTTFPLKPGADLDIEAADIVKLVLVWTSPSGRSSSWLDDFEPEPADQQDRNAMVTR